MRLTLSITALAFLASGCDQSSQPAPKPQIKVQSAEQKRMHQLNEMDRAITLKRAIYDSGFTCKRIERSGYVQDHGNLSMWTAHCADKRDWAIFVGPDSSVQVRPCKDLAQLKLPACIIRDDKKDAPAT